MNRKKVTALFIILVSLSQFNVSNAEDVLYSRSNGYTMEQNYESYKIKKGETLNRIIRRELKLQKNLNNVAIKIVRQNPRSFPTRDKNFMLSGTTLNLSNLGSAETPLRNRNEIFSIR